MPAGYRSQLEGIEVLFGRYNAPYFPGPEFDFSTPAGKLKRKDSDETARQSMESGKTGVKRKLTTEARELWPAYRGIEEYAREVFPVEEEANGKTWMRDKNVHM